MPERLRKDPGSACWWGLGGNETPALLFAVTTVLPPLTSQRTPDTASAAAPQKLGRQWKPHPHAHNLIWAWGVGRVDFLRGYSCKKGANYRK